jgi:predicted nucleic acid-binding protein
VRRSRRTSSAGIAITGTSTVVDASVVVRSVLGESEDAAEWFRSAWRGDTVLEAPELIVVETANALSRYIRRGQIGVSDAYESVVELLGEAIRLTPLRTLVLPALDVALERNLSVYDACYAVLAERLDAVLVTADKDLAAACSRAELLE